MSAENLQALMVLISAFGVSAFSGLSAHLRFARTLRPVTVIGGTLNSGCLGLIISLIWYQNYQQAENVFGLIGICAAAGLCGSKVTDVLVSILSGAGIDVTIVHKADHTGDDAHDHRDPD
jgi:hypothetical protein